MIELIVSILQLVPIILAGLLLEFIAALVAVNPGNLRVVSRNAVALKTAVAAFPQLISRRQLHVVVARLVQNCPGGPFLAGQGATVGMIKFDPLQPVTQVVGHRNPILGQREVTPTLHPAHDVPGRFPVAR